MGHGLCALLLAIAEVQVGARAEVRGGEAPPLAGQAPEGTARSTLEPEAGLQVRTHGSRFRLHYGPRLTFRAPALPGSEQPLLLHVLGAEAESRLSRGVRALGDAQTSFGDVDYASLGQTLGTSQGALPTITRLLTVGGGATVEVREVQRWILQSRLAATHQRPLDSGTPMTGATLQDSTFIEASQSARHRLTRRNDLTLRASASDQRLSSGLDVLALSPEVSWQARLSRAHTLDVGGGVVFARAISRPAGAGQPDVASPVLHAALQSRTRPARGLALESEIGAAATWFLDPVLVTSLTRGTVGARVAATFRRDLSVSASAQLATSLTQNPLPGEPDETVLRAELPVRYRISPSLTVEVGGRYSDRGRHLLASSIGLHQRELWAYAQLIATTTTRLD